MQLLVRAVFYGLTTQLDQDIQTNGGIVLLIVLLCLQSILQPFKHSFKNIQESLILSNLLTVYAITALNNDRNSNKTLFVKLFINVQLAYFIIYITGHSVMAVCGKTVTQKCDQIFNFFTRKCYKSVKHLQKGYNCEIPEVTYKYQEFQDPLIGLDM